VIIPVNSPGLAQIPRCLYLSDSIPRGKCLFNWGALIRVRFFSAGDIGFGKDFGHAAEEDATLRPPWRKSPNQKRKRRSSDICQAAALGFAWQDIWRDIEGNDAGNTDQPEHAEQFDLER
jgi:hypothetical protein